MESQERLCCVLAAGWSAPPGMIMSEANEDGEHATSPFSTRLQRHALRGVLHRFGREDLLYHLRIIVHRYGDEFHPRLT
jgi:hypothetical protein